MYSMTKRKIVLLNGPPRCGKDTVATYLEKEHGFYHTKFAKALKEGVHAILRLGTFDVMNRFTPHPHDYYEQFKDTQMPEFLGYTPREGYISLSEEYMKDRFGKSIYGDLLLPELLGVNNDKIVVSDSGFFGEMIPILNHRKKFEIVLVRITRPGTSFEGDSRSYVTKANCDHVALPSGDIENDGTQEDLRNRTNYLLTQMRFLP
jgi:hypothetical protein